MVPAMNSGNSQHLQNLYDGETLFHGHHFRFIKEVVACNDSGLLLRCSNPCPNDEECEMVFEDNVDGFAADVVFQSLLVWTRWKYGAASLPKRAKCFKFFQRIPNNADFYVTLSISRASKTLVSGACWMHSKHGEVFAYGEDLDIVVNQKLAYRAPVPRKIPRVEIDARVAVVGIALNYAGASSLDEFWTTLIAQKVATTSISAAKLQTANKNIHMAPNGISGADGIVTDKYGVLSDKHPRQSTISCFYWREMPSKIRLLNSFRRLQVS